MIVMMIILIILTIIITIFKLVILKTNYDMYNFNHISLLLTITL